MNIKASTREKLGKGAAKAARRENKVPATVYGKDFSPVSVLIDVNDIKHAVRTLGRHAVVNLNLDDGRTQNVMIQYISYEPLSGSILNVELRALKAGEKVKVTVPIILTGGDLIRDAVVLHTLQELTILVDADKVPSEITRDISHLQIGDVKKVSDLTPPEGIEILTSPDETIVSITAPRVFEEPAAEDLDAAAERVGNVENAETVPGDNES